jgi:hypothetical protein
MVLIVSLLFLFLLGVFATTMLHTSTLQLKMAGNNENRVEVRNRALAIIDWILSDPDSVQLRGPVGYRVCAASKDPDSPDCDSFSLSLADTGLLDSPSGAAVDYYVDRMGPLERPVSYMTEERVHSTAVFSIARQEITVVFDRTAQGRGFAQATQGYFRLITGPEAITISAE